MGTYFAGVAVPNLKVQEILQEAMSATLLITAMSLQSRVDPRAVKSFSHKNNVKLDTELT